MDLGNVIGRTGDVVLDQVSTLEYGNLCGFGANADRHHVATDWTTVALTTLALFKRFLVEVWSVATKDRLNRLRCDALALLALLLVLLTILGLLALLGILSLLSVLALLLTTTATATTATTSTSAISASWLARGLTLVLQRRVGFIRFWSRSTIANLWLGGNRVIGASGLSR